MRKLLLLLSVAFMSFSLATAQSTKRKQLKPDKVVLPEAVQTVTDLQESVITIPDSIANSVRISDFRKTVASRVESMMITNLSQVDTIKSISVDIDYRTPDGRQLNRRTVDFDVVVPPTESRHVSTPSWDKQMLFYHESTPPKRKSQRTSPFRIVMSIQRVTVTHPEL